METCKSHFLGRVRHATAHRIATIGAQNVIHDHRCRSHLFSWVQLSKEYTLFVRHRKEEAWTTWTTGEDARRQTKAKEEERHGQVSTLLRNPRDQDGQRFGKAGPPLHRHNEGCPTRQLDLLLTSSTEWCTVWAFPKDWSSKSVAQAAVTTYQSLSS